MPQPKLRARCRQNVKDMLREIGTSVVFPAKFANIGQSADANPGIAQFDLPAGAKGKGGIGQFCPRDLLQKCARFRTHQPQHGQARGDVCRNGVCIVWNAAYQPRKIAGLRTAERNNQNAVGRRARDGHIRLDPASIIPPLRINDLPRENVDIGRRDVVENAARIATLQQELGKAALIEQCHIFGGVQAFGTRVFEPALAPVGIPEFRRPAVADEKARPLEPCRFGHHSACFQQPVVERAAPNAARGFELTVGPVHREG